MSLLLNNGAWLDSNNNYIVLGGTGTASVLISPNDSFLIQYQTLNNNPYVFSLFDGRSNNVQWNFSSNAATLYFNSNLCQTSNLTITGSNTIGIKKNLYSYNLYINNNSIFNYNLSNFGYVPFDQGIIQWSGSNIIDNFGYQPVIIYENFSSFTNIVQMSNLICNKFTSPELVSMSNITLAMSNIVFGPSNQPVPYSFCNINTSTIITSNDIPLSLNPCLPNNYLNSLDTLTNISTLSSNGPNKMYSSSNGWSWNYISNQYVDLGPISFNPGNGFTLMTKFSFNPVNNSNQTIYKTTSSSISNNTDAIWLYSFSNSIGNAFQADSFSNQILSSRLTSYGWNSNTPYSVALRYNNQNSNYLLTVNGSNVGSSVGLFSSSNKQYTSSYCGLDYFSGQIYGANLYPYYIPDTTLFTYQGMTQYANTPYRLPESFRNIGVDFTPQSTNFRTSISNYNVTVLNSNVYSSQTFSNFGNFNIGSNLTVNQSLSNLGPVSLTSNLVVGQSLSNLGPVSLTSNLIVGQSLSNLGPVSLTSNLIVNQNLSNLGNAIFSSNVIVLQSLSNNATFSSNVIVNNSLSNFGSGVTFGNNIIGGAQSNIGNVSLAGGTLYVKGDISNVGYSAISNNALYASNTSYFGSNTSTYNSNTISGYLYNFFTSNIQIQSSFSNQGSLVNFGDCVIGKTLSNIGPVSLLADLNVKGNINNSGLTAISNQGFFSSNTAVYASNNLVSSSSTASVSNSSVYASNTAYFSSNIGVYSSNQIVTVNNTAQFALANGNANTAVLNSNLTTFTTSNLTTSNLSFGPQYGQTSTRIVVGTINTPGQSLNSTGGANGAITYAPTLQLKPGDVTGNFWGGNPTNFGADLVLAAGNINQGQGNNGTAYVSGYGGSVRILPGFSYVNTAGAGNNRYVESGRIYFYNTNTNGQSIDVSCNICGTFDNLGRFGLNTSNPGYQLDVRGDVFLSSNVFLTGGSNLNVSLLGLSSNAIGINSTLSNNIYNFASNIQSSVVSLSNFSVSTFSTISNLNSLSNFSISLSNYSYQNSNSVNANVSTLSNYTYSNVSSLSSNLISLSNFTINLNSTVFSGFANTNGNLVSLSNYTIQLSSNLSNNYSISNLTNYTLSNLGKAYLTSIIAPTAQITNLTGNTNFVTNQLFQQGSTPGFYIGSSLSNTVSGYIGFNNTNPPSSTNSLGIGVFGSTGGITINSNGLVGITNSVPSYNLDIGGSARLSASQSKFVLNSTQGGGGTQAGFDMYTYQQSTIPGASIYTVDDASFGGHLVFLTKTTGASNNPNVERFRINSSGNIGVGTNTPSYLLDVNGAAHIASNLLIGNTPDITRAVSILNSNLTSNNPYYITLGQSIGLNNQTEIAYTHVSSGSPNNNFTIGFYGNSTRPLTITANNLIGINNPSPAFGFHQSCSNGSGGAMCLSSPYANEASFKWSNLNNAWIGGIGSYGTGSNFGLGSATYGGLFFITHSGNTGIGIANSNPQYTLDVSGTIRSTGSHLIAGANPLSAGFDVTGKETNAGKISYQGFSGNCLDIVGAGSNAGNRRVYIFDQLGVSTFPNYTLDIGGTAHVNGQLLLRDGNSNDTSRFISALNNSISSFNFSGISFGQSSTTNNSAELNYYHAANGSSSNTVSLGFYQNNRILTVNAGGFCGINNNNPAFNLDVSGTSRITGSLVQNTVYQWRYNFSGNSAAAPSGGGNIAWNSSNFTYSTVGSINMGNTLLTQSATPTNYNYSAPIIQFPYSGIYSLNLQCRFNTSSAENALWFAPFISSTYGETSSNSAGTRLSYISNSSYNTPIHYTGYFAANDTLALLAFSATAGIYLQTGFYNGLTVQLIQRTS